MQDFVLNHVRAYWTAQVFTPESMGDNSVPKYSFTGIVSKDHPQIDALRQTAGKVAKERFSSTIGLSWPFIDADTHKDTVKHPELKNSYTLRASSKFKPPFIDMYGNELREDDGKLFPGCYVNLHLKFFTYERNGHKGVGSILLGGQATEEGEPFGKVSTATLPFKILPKPAAQNNEEPGWPFSLDNDDIDF